VNIGIRHPRTCRSRYAEFLKMDFPRLPRTSYPELFRNLCALTGTIVLVEQIDEAITASGGWPIS
jgi:hypothetical protein